MKYLPFKTALLAAALVAFSATAATDMLTSSGATSAPTTSSCPSPLPAGSPTCGSGWFSLRGAKTAVVHVYETTGTHTSTVILEQRLKSTDGTYTLKTWTDAAATEVGVNVYPPAGEIRIRVTALQAGGTVKAVLESYAMTGLVLW